MTAMLTADEVRDEVRALARRRLGPRHARSPSGGSGSPTPAGPCPRGRRSGSGAGSRRGRPRRGRGAAGRRRARPARRPRPAARRPDDLAHGTDEQKERYLRPDRQRAGGVVPAVLASRAPAPTSRRCRRKAVRDGDEWIINGQKVWTSGAQTADLGMLLARTDPDAPKHKGISYFAFPMDQPGVEVRPLREMTGRVAVQRGVLRRTRVSPTTRSSAGSAAAGSVANTTLANERAGLGGRRQRRRRRWVPGQEGRDARPRGRRPRRRRAGADARCSRRVPSGSCALHAATSREKLGRNDRPGDPPAARGAVHPRRGRPHDRRCGPSSCAAPRAAASRATATSPSCS